MKRILVVAPGYLPLLGGMEEQCFLLAKEIMMQNCKVDILTERTKDEFESFEKSEVADIYRLERPNRSSIFGYLKLAISIIRFMMRHNEYDFIIIRTLTFHGLVMGFLKLIGIIKVKTFITAETGGENDELDAIRESRLQKIYVFLFGKHDYINSLTDINYRKFIELKFNKKQLTKIHNGVDCSEYGNVDYPKKINKFLFIAQLRKEKGIYELLEAFKCVSEKRNDVILRIAGDGPERAGVIEFIKTNSLENNISYLGRIAREERTEFYRSGDCLVLPSYSESFGLVFAEAAVYKRAIIATDVADLKEIYGENIVFCEKRNVEDLALKMIQIMDKYRKEKMNYDDSIKKIDIKKTVNEILYLLEK